TLRAYIVAYLKDHPVIEHEKMTFLVRQLQPGPQGIPLEIYVFSKDTRWVNYEGIQADIFDHILAIIPEFGLRVFQSPTGQDLARLIPCVAKVGGEERKSMVSPS
ncbi:MAG: mechanosensitive ion channel family protein, partial [Thermoanaerobaculia bacterium]